MHAPDALPPRLLRRLMAWLDGLSALDGLAAEMDETYRRVVERRGRRRAAVWYLLQLLRTPPALAQAWCTGRSSPAAGVRSVATELGQSLRRLVRLRWSLTVPFVALLAVGIASTVAMVQIRRSLQHVDLGIATDVHQVRWRSPDGQPRAVVDASVARGLLEVPVDGLAALLPVSVGTRALDTPHRWIGSTIHDVPSGFLAMLGVRPLFGRDVSAAGDVLLAHDFWRAHWPNGEGLGDEVFAANGLRHVVVGVASPSFDGPVCCVRPSAWVVGGGRSNGAARLFAVGLADPEPTSARVAARLGGLGEPAEDVTFADVRQASLGIDGALTVLLWLSVLAFAGTLLNGSNLLLSDLVSRRAELRMRLAIGASRARLAARVWIETAWLGLGAAIAGGVLGALTMVLAPAWIPLLSTPGLAVDVRFGWPAFASTAAGATAVAVLAGVPAAVAAFVSSRGTALPDRVRAGSAGRTRLAGGLLACQVAIAVALAAVSLVHRSALSALDGSFVGYRHGAAAVYFTSSVPGRAAGVAGELVDAVTQLPGVGRAAVAQALPVYGAPRSVVELDGQEEVVAVEQATEGYLELLGLPLIAGAAPRDASEAVLSEDVARRHAGAAPSTLLGTTVRIEDDVVRIVGIAESATWGTGAWRPTLYRGWAADDSPADAVLLVRPDGSGERQMTFVGAAAAQAGLALAPFGTLDSLLVRSRVAGEFLARSASVFSLICLAVALGGVATHFGRWVRSRSKDIGIRMCFGASRASVRRSVLAAACGPVGVGLAAGAAIAWTSARTMVALMPEAPGGLSGPIVVAIVFVALLAGLTVLVPADAAARTNPLEVLRRD